MFIKLVQKFASFFEAIIKAILDKKEALLIPALKRYWPPWLTPNRLTVIRLLLAIAIIPWVLLFDYQGNVWLAVVLVLALLTDFLDGLVARALRLTSPIGSLFDKIVDKVLVLPLGVVEFWQYDPWLVWLSIIGIIVVSFLAVVRFFRSGKTVVPENTAGKLTMACYSLAILIAIWPEYQLWADRIAWGGLCLGISSVTHNILAWQRK